MIQTLLDNAPDEVRRNLRSNTTSRSPSHAPSSARCPAHSRSGAARRRELSKTAERRLRALAHTPDHGRRHSFWHHLRGRVHRQRHPGWMAASMSAFVYAGAAQFVAVGLISGGAGSSSSSSPRSSSTCDTTCTPPPWRPHPQSPASMAAASGFLAHGRNLCRGHATFRPTTHLPGQTLVLPGFRADHVYPLAAVDLGGHMGGSEHSGPGKLGS